MLNIQQLHASIEDKEILQGIDLRVNAGEVHAIMGHNGAGKSTLSAVLAGKPGYTVTQGSVTFCGKDMLAMSPEERSHNGFFLSFQYPVEIQGVSNINFLKMAVAQKRKYLGLPELSAAEFLKKIRECAALVEMEQSFLSRSVNTGFSGGEKKRNEILQMAMLEPKLAMLDETDSGLDIDALRVVANGINRLRNANNAIILITHYQRLLDYIVPDFVHIIEQGKIVKTGDKSLALELEEKGYQAVV
ncbi:ABC transporter ATP-binding protein [Bacteroidia bacterium]|nr:ABC transporter ATP-binding protein [Bacteroidia bacterium]